MSDFKIPELPSDDELGITEEDRKKHELDEEPELSPEEMAALLGESPRPSEPSSPARPKGKSGKKDKKTDKGPEAGPPPGGPPPGDPPGKGAPPSPDEPAGPKRPQEPKGPRSRWRGPVMLAALVVGAWFTSSYRTLPAPEPANAPDSVFSSARAMANLVEIARRPHPPGSPAHAQVRGYLEERLRDLGLVPQIQTTTSLVGRGTTVRATTVRNIIARIPGRASTGTLVLTAHYDGREISRGAGDDGSGVVAILEVVRALNAGPDLQNDILVLITDAEELGLMGARAFVDQHPAMADVQAVISLEMRGAGGPSVMFETGPENGWIVRALKESGARPYANAMSYEVYKSLPNDTDFTPFREAGRQGLNFAAIGRASIYHQNYDSPENLSEATLQQHGESTLRVTRYLAGTSLAEPSAPDVTFVTLPALGLVVYDVGLALPLAAALLILALVVLLPIRKTARRWSGMAVGLVLATLTVAGTAGAGYGLMAWLPRFHPEYGSLHGSAFHHEGWYVSALVAAALFLAATLFGTARRRFAAAELTWGALVVPLGAMVFVALRFPAAAVNLQIPLAASLLAAALLVVPASGRLSTVLWLFLLALAVPVLAVTVPVLEFVWIGLSFRAAAAIGAVAAILALLLLPALERLREPNAWWAPTTALVLGLALVAVGIQQAAPDSQRPAPSTLAYVYDHGSAEALWITDASQDAVDAPALAWATAKAGSDFTETRPMDRYGIVRREPRVTAAPTHEVRMPEVWALTDSAAGGTRHLRLAVRSSVGAELIQFRFAADGGTTATQVNGRPLPTEERALVVEHWGAPDPVVTLDLQMAEGVTLEMDVVEHLFRPQEVVGEAPFQRPPELAPDIVWLSDRAILRTPSSALEVIPGPPPFSLEPTPQPIWRLGSGGPGQGTGAMDADNTLGVHSEGADTVAMDSLAGDSAVVEPQAVDSLAGRTMTGGDTVPATRSLQPADSTAAATDSVAVPAADTLPPDTVRVPTTASGPRRPR